MHRVVSPKGCVQYYANSSYNHAITCPFASMRCHFALWLIILFSVVAMARQQDKTPTGCDVRLLSGGARRQRFRPPFETLSCGDPAPLPIAPHFHSIFRSAFKLQNITENTIKILPGPNSR